MEFVIVRQWIHGPKGSGVNARFLTVLFLGICPQLLKVLLLGQAVTTLQLNEDVMVSYREKGSMSIKYNDVVISF